MDPSVDLNNLVVFTEVIQAGSFSAAGRRLGLPKSSISRRISALEDRLGTRLLQRSTRALHLTEAGRVYLAHCERILAEVDAAERALGQLREQPSGLLRVSAPYGVRLLDEAFAELLARYGDLRVELHSSDRNVSLIDEGFDLVIRAGPLEDSSLVARKLTLTQLRLYASPAYLNRRGTPTHPRELEGHDCLVFGAGRARTWSFTRGNEHEGISPDPRLLTNEYPLLCTCAIAGQGFAVLPEIVAEAGHEQGLLVHVLPDWTLPEIGLYAVYPSAEHLAPKVAALIEVLTRVRR